MHSILKNLELRSAYKRLLRILINPQSPIAVSKNTSHSPAAIWTHLQPILESLPSAMFERWKRYAIA